MKLRTIFLFGAGVVAGLAIAKKMNEDDPAVLHGPAQGKATSNPALAVVSDQAQRVVDLASVKSLDAIRRTRGAIRARLGEDDVYDDDAAWS
jgi:hypothetical protein